MNKHYFLGGEIGGWFKSSTVLRQDKTKVHLQFFLATLILRRTFWLSIFCIVYAACSPDKPPDSIQNPLDGKAIYRKYCVTCHGSDGTLGLNGAGDLTKSVLGLEERVEQITKGKNLMTAFEGVLTREEIRAVAVYTETLKK
ncbi:MAG: c-type cytochrome [Saprospiraceae bacterium]